MEAEGSACEFYSKGNEAFVEENYEEAIKYYSQAIDKDESRAEYYTTRSTSYFKLGKYKECKEDGEKAIELGTQNPKLYLRKGISCYHLGEYDEAKSSFNLGQECEGAKKTEFADWIVKCENKLKLKIPQPVIAQPAAAKIRHDWYQTEPLVYVSVLLKNAKKENVEVKFTEKTLRCHVNLEEEDQQTYALDLQLAHEIVPSQSSWQVLSSKIEMKLKKVEGIQWSTLEYTGTEPAVKFLVSAPSAAATSNISHTYPSSSAKKKDWDKIVDEIKKDEASEAPEGEAAVNQLFQKIYSEGSDEVRRAMNKSFTESGGTVLSTNWKDVGQKRVDIKPPDGMEWKNWEM